jgi:hypothetical protein
MHMTSTNRSHSELDEAPAGGSSREQAHGGLRDADTTKRFRTVPRLGRRGEGRGGGDVARKDLGYKLRGFVGALGVVAVGVAVRLWCCVGCFRRYGGVVDTAGP